MCNENGSFSILQFLNASSLSFEQFDQINEPNPGNEHEIYYYYLKEKLRRILNVGGDSKLYFMKPFQEVAGFVEQNEFETVVRHFRITNELFPEEKVI